MRLSGWQRLWVVVSVFWLVGSGIVLWPDWQHSHAVYLDDQGNAIPSRPKSLTEKVRAKFPHAYDDLSDAELEAKVREKHFTDPDVVTMLVSVVIVDDMGTEHVFPAGFDEQRAIGIVRQAMEQAHQGERRRLAASWLLPPLALYALGWAIAWVYRGFTRRGAK